MENIKGRLARHPFLRGVPTANLELLADDTRIKVFQPGELLFRKGTKANYLFLIEKGVVEVGLLKGDKAGPVVITRVLKGGSLGWSWAFKPYRWKFDARAKSRVEALLLEGKPVIAKMGRYPLLGYEVMSHLARSLAGALEATRHQLVKVRQRRAETDFIFMTPPFF